VKGLASNFPKAVRSKVFETVFGKPVPGGRDPLSLKISDGKIGEYKDDEVEGVQRIYPTKELKKDTEVVAQWIKGGNSLIIVGKEGCGKSILLEASIQ
jgi:hypothetical protein